MLDLHTLGTHDFGDECTSDHIRFAANVIMLGLVYANSYAGRPGEWVRMPRQQAVEHVNGKRTYLTFAKHKTSQKFGKHGRFAPAGNKKAMEIVLRLHPEDSMFFLQSSRAQAPDTPVVADNLLEKYGKVYTPEKGHPGATLQRKYFHSEAKDSSEVNEKFQTVFSELCKADCHSKETGDKHYALSKPHKDAARTAATVISVCGEHVCWPDDDFLVEGLSMSICRIRPNFFGKRQSTKQGSIEDELVSDVGEEHDEEADYGYDDESGDENADDELRDARASASGVTPKCEATKQQKGSAMRRVGRGIRMKQKREADAPATASKDKSNRDRAKLKKTTKATRIKRRKTRRTKKIRRIRKSKKIRRARKIRHAKLARAMSSAMRRRSAKGTASLAMKKSKLLAMAMPEPMQSRTRQVHPLSNYARAGCPMQSMK